MSNEALENDENIGNVEIAPVKLYDPKEVEKQMIESAQNRADDPAESAAMIYTMYRPEFLRRAKKLSSRGKARVLELLVQYPLNGEAVFSNELEKEAYFLADSMIQAKFVLMMETYKNSAEQLVTAQDEFIFNAKTEEETVEGNTNETV